MSLALLASLELAGACALPDPEKIYLCEACFKECPSGLTCKQGVCISPEDDCGIGSGSTSSGTGATVDGSTGSKVDVTPVDSCSGDGDICAPRWVTSKRLPVFCAGDEVEVELEVECTCPDAELGQVTWANYSLVDGLELSDDGTLTGSPDPGNYVVSVSATIDETSMVDRDFELTVLNYCTVAFANQEANNDAPHVAGADLRSGEILWQTASETSDGALLSFEVGPDGGHLVQLIEDAEQALKLELFELQAAAATAQPLQYAGTYITHAFSPEGRWLALITSDPQETNREQLQVFDLAESPPVRTASETIDYFDALTWSGENRLLYMGPVVGAAPAEAALEYELVDGELEAQPANLLITGDPVADAITHFRISDAGYLAIGPGRVTYYDRSTGEATNHPSPWAVTSDVGWVASADSDKDGGMRVDPVDEYVRNAPYSLAPDCNLLLSWAEDGSRMLCVKDLTEFVIYETDHRRNFLESQPLDVAFVELFRANRATFSPNGDWLAFVPNRDGLSVVHQDDFTSVIAETPELEGNDAELWDFFFTPRGDRIVVHREQDLFVANLPELSFESPPVTLDPPTRCPSNWVREADLWCGAPQVRGPIRVAPTETHLALSDSERNVQVVDLDTLVPRAVGTIPASCSESCIQFQ